MAVAPNDSNRFAVAPPFPWFGGKRRVADVVWKRFGDVAVYTEPFFGSGAVLLNRPHDPRIENVNDKDCFVANFWRATQQDPEAVAEWSDWPVNEADLHARHLWLITEGKSIVERLRTDPDFYDAKIAGWWVWGICQWIGSGWCDTKAFTKDGGCEQKRPNLGDGVRGVHRTSQKRPHLGDAGLGVHRTSQKRPHLGDAGRGVHQHYAYFQSLSARLRRVRVCCGDWSRVCGHTPTDKCGTAGVFLDPPYPTEADRDMALYAEECGSVAHDVAKWAIENGDRKSMRIAFCGYEGSHQFPPSWECYAWKARGGYASQSGGDNENARRERIWFSPHCLKPEATKSLFKELEN